MRARPMSERSEAHPAHTGTTGGLPVAPALADAASALRLPQEPPSARRRTLLVVGWALVVAFAAAWSAEILIGLIDLFTNLSFYGRLSFAPVSPADNHIGLLVLVVPVIGGLVVGVMARWGSPAIRGHGIPEAMERILFGESRIPPRVTLLKPLGSAISIGTGGPFGAEGPIIATGGALGSLLGQLTRTTADERKVLLAAGAAAGMTAVFGSPVAAVLLAVELLLFEYRARSLIPVALAACMATAVKFALHGTAPAFPMPDVPEPGGVALALYVVLGAVTGFVSVYVTHGVYAVEDFFEGLPIHWMWWPAIGAVAVGVLGYIAPHTLGVGYDNIRGILSGTIVGRALAVLVVCKLISWTIALGSGTAGGTLAPLFTIGGGFGALVGAGLAYLFPQAGIDPRVAALVGMAAMFAGASRALLASVVFAFETTRQPLGLLPLLGGCSAAYLISLMRMKHTIMTERLARRGVPIRTEYTVDYLHQLLVRDAASSSVITLRADAPLSEVREWLARGADGATHQGFPVLDDREQLVGVVTRRGLTDPAAPAAAPVGSLLSRPPVVIYDDSSLREAADQMVREKVGRLPVVQRSDTRKVVGIITRSDLLGAHAGRLASEQRSEPIMEVPRRWWKRETAAR